MCNTDLHLDIGNGVLLEKVDKFCYLGNILDAHGGCDSAVTASVRSAWKKFCEYLPILTGKGFSLKLNGKVYATCVRSCLMHGSENWPMKVEHEMKMNRTEMSMSVIPMWLAVYVKCIQFLSNRTDKSLDVYSHHHDHIIIVA